MSELDALTEDPELDEAPEVENTDEATPEPEQVEETAEPTAAPEAPQTIPLAALQDERRKRQELEAELNEIRARQTQPERPDLFVDPDAALDMVRNEARQHADQRWIQACRAMAQAQHADYGDKESIFMDLAKDNPTLAQEMLKADNPALFAYQTAEKHEKFQRMQNVDDYEKHVRAEIEAKVRAEMGGRPDLVNTPGVSSQGLPSDDDLSAIVLGDA